MLLQKLRMLLTLLEYTVLNHLHHLPRHQRHETKTTPSYDIKSLAETIGDNMTHADLNHKDLDRSTNTFFSKTADGHYRVG